MERKTSSAKNTELGGPSEISHRAWFSPEEYKQLYTATRQRVREPEKKDFNWEAEHLHDFVLFAVNTGLRPDEAGAT